MLNVIQINDLLLKRESHEWAVTGAKVDWACWSPTAHPHDHDWPTPVPSTLNGFDGFVLRSQMVVHKKDDEVVIGVGVVASIAHS